jgi:hypothetical protein
VSFFDSGRRDLLGFRYGSPRRQDSYTGPGGIASVPGSGCTDCGSEYEMYALVDEVWFRSAKAHSNTVLCIPCLERRLRRRLTASDFKPEAIVNDPNSARWPHTAMFRDRLRGWTYIPA